MNLKSKKEKTNLGFTLGLWLITPHPPKKTLFIKLNCLSVTSTVDPFVYWFTDDAMIHILCFFVSHQRTSLIKQSAERKISWDLINLDTYFKYMNVFVFMVLKEKKTEFLHYIFHYECISQNFQVYPIWICLLQQYQRFQMYTAPGTSLFISVLAI